MKFKGWKGDDLTNKIVAIFGLAVVVVILASLFIPQECNGIDNNSLYCAFHPASILNVIGVLILSALVLAITGIWKYFAPPVYFETAYDGLKLAIAALVVAVIGGLLAFS